MGGNQPTKTSWPELVGAAAEEAEKKIKEEMPGADVQVVPHDSFAPWISGLKEFDCLLILRKSSGLQALANLPDPPCNVRLTLNCGPSPFSHPNCVWACFGFMPVMI